MLINSYGHNVNLKMGFNIDSAFSRLFGDAQVVGTDLALSNTSAGTRDSVVSGGAVRGENEVDLTLVGGLPVIGVLGSYAEVNTSLGTGYGADTPACTPSWTSEGTIIQAVMPYGWTDGDLHPVNPSAARFWGASQILVGPGTIVYQDAGSTNQVITGLDIDDGGALSILSSDWNATTLGFRLDDNARQTTTGTITPPSGTLYVGNRSDAARAFHGALFTAIFPRVLSDDEYNVIRSYLTSVLGGLTLA